MVLSWALTEVVRYAFYAATLFLGNGSVPAFLTWARYSTFFVLYPTGAGSEALVNFATLPVSLARGGAWWDVRPLAQWDVYALVRGVLFIAWWPGTFIFYMCVLTRANWNPVRRTVSDVYAHDQTAP
jgi:very-long-chain (3R)-3-hydroxyacyl-CoA dehydratase